MSGFDGYEGERDERELVFNRLDHDDAERLLSGEIPEGEGALAAVIAEIRADSAAEIPSGLAAQHITAAADAVGSRPAARAAERPRRPLFANATARALAAVAMALGLVVAAGAFGWLPGPIQTAVANAAEVVGIRLPRQSPPLPAADAATTTTSTTTTRPSVTSTTVATSTTTSTTEGENHDDRGALEPLVGAHIWNGTSCEGSPLDVRYRVRSEGTLALTSVSDPNAETDLEQDRIEVGFPDGVTVRIDLEGHGDEWELRVDEDRECESDDGSHGDSDDEGSDHDSDGDSDDEGSDDDSGNDDEGSDDDSGDED